MSSQLLAEVFLCQSEASAVPSNQNISASQVSPLIAAKVQSSALLLTPTTFQPQQCLRTPVISAPHGTVPVQQTYDHDPSNGTTAIQGVVFSPDGSHLAAYSSTRVYVAAVDAAASNKPTSPTSNRQTHNASNAAGTAAAVPQSFLHQAAVVPQGIKSVHWCPYGEVLAVCSRDKAGVILFLLQDSQHTHQHYDQHLHQQQPEQQQQQQRQNGDGLLRHVLTLTGPSQKRPLAATWLPAPHSTINSSSSRSGRQVPIPISNGGSKICQQTTVSDSSSSSSSSSRAKATACPVLGLLVSWPSHLQLTTWTQQQQGTGGINWGYYVTRTILTGWPGPPRVLLALTCTHPGQIPEPHAAAAVDGGSGVEAGGVGGGSGRKTAAASAAAGNSILGASRQQQQQQAAMCGTQVMVVATVEPELAWSAAAAAQQQQLQISKPHTQPPPAAAQPAAAVVEAAASAGNSSSSSSSGSSARGGVLDSLMNIGSSQQQQQQQQQEQEGALQLGGLFESAGPPKIQLLDATPTAAAAAAGVSNSLGGMEATSSVLGGGSSSSGSAQAAPSYLCLLVLDLAKLSHQRGLRADLDLNQPAASHTLDCTLLGPPAVAGDMNRINATQFNASQRSDECVTVLPLPQQRLPRYLAAQGSLVAVSSSTGTPRVTLAAVSARRGLQLLQTFDVPMPRAVAPPAAAAGGCGSSSSISGGKQARLQGLLLLPSGGSCTAFDAVDSAVAGCSTAAGAETAEAAEGLNHGGLVALLACSDKPSGHLGGFLHGISGKKKGPGSAVDMYMVQLELHLAVQQQQHKQQHHHQASSGVRMGTIPESAAAAGQVQEPQQQQEQQAQRHTAKLQVQQQAHQQRAQQQQQQQQQQPVDGSSAVVAALQALQLSLEGRLDAMQHTLQRMEQRLEALERKTDR